VVVGIDVVCVCVCEGVLNYPKPPVDIDNSTWDTGNGRSLSIAAAAFTTATKRAPCSKTIYPVPCTEGCAYVFMHIHQIQNGGEGRGGGGGNDGKKKNW
jgi:hypothetical protein